MNAIFMTRIKSVLAVVLVVGLALGGIGPGVGLSTNPAAVAQAETPREAPGKEESPTPPVVPKKEEKPLHFVEKTDMKPQLERKLPYTVPTDENPLVPSKAFIADICLPGRIRFRELIDPRYLKKHGLTDRDMAYEILDHQGLDNYQVADDIRTVLFQVQSRGGKEKEVIIVRWVVYEGHLYLSPENAPDPKTGIFKPWILRKKVSQERTFDELWDQEIVQALHLGDPVNHPDVAPNKTVSGQLKPPGANFARVAGPGWLTIKADGSFTGKPEESDSGVNTWLVSVTERDGAPAYIKLQTKVIGTSMFAENFNRYHGHHNALQWQSEHKVAHNGRVTGWTKAGEHCMHAVDRANRANRAGQRNAQNWAVMIFQDNVITSGAFAANASGQVYRIDFEASPAVYENTQQATQAGDELRIEVLRGDDRVLASHKHSPGAWTGTLKFAAGSFQYTGDGLGDVRLRIKPTGPQTSGRFHGAIDNVIVRKDEAKK